MSEVLIAGGDSGIKVRCKTCDMLLAHEGDHVIGIYGDLVMGPEGYGIRCPLCGDVRPWQVPGVTGPGEFKQIDQLSPEMQNAIRSAVVGFGYPGPGLDARNKGPGRT